jgi:hypothetical protein
MIFISYVYSSKIIYVVFRLVIKPRTLSSVRCDTSQHIEMSTVLGQVSFWD